VVPEMMPVAFGTVLLGLGSAAAVAGSMLPHRRRILAGAAVLLVAGAGAVFGILLGERWALTGPVPLLSHLEACLQALVGLSLGATILACGGPVSLRASAGASLVGVGLGALALGDDPELLWAAPAVQFFPAFLHYTLKWVSFGVLLAAVGGAGARLLDRRTEDGVPEAWDAALHRVVGIGLPLLMASFLVGAFWHGLAWSAPFAWDAGETWTLAIVLSFLGWVHLRQVAAPASRVPALVLLLGGLLMAGWWTYLHSAPGVMNSIELWY